MQRPLAAVTALLALALTSSCSTTLTAEAAPDADLGTAHSFYVAHQEKDGRGIDGMITDELQRWGRTATSGAPDAMPPDTSILVTYSDRWQWDMSMYMVSLELQLRDAQTEAVLASGKSLRTSLVRREPLWHVRSVLKEIFAKCSPGEDPPPEPLDS